MNAVNLQLYGTLRMSLYVRTFCLAFASLRSERFTIGVWAGSMEMLREMRA